MDFNAHTTVPLSSFVRRRLVRSVALAALCGAMAMLSYGCNTMQGAGQDIEAAGEGIEDAAD